MHISGWSEEKQTISLSQQTSKTQRDSLDQYSSYKSLQLAHLLEIATIDHRCVKGDRSINPCNGKRPRENRRWWCVDEAQKGMQEMATMRCPEGTECKLSTAGKARSQWKRLESQETITVNAKASYPQIPPSRVSVRLSYTSVVKVGDQWLICHTHQQKQSVSMFK